MGVIHKLTEDVINFILEKKKENPKIGCRSLSEIVSERFSRKVSKSSINAVLKEYGLSGAVGRPISAEGQKRSPFSIPQEKKVQLFGPKPSVAPPEPVTIQEKEPFERRESDDEARLSLMADPLLKETIGAVEQPKTLQKKRQPIAGRSQESFLDEVEIIREKERQEFGADLLSAGTVYIHAAAYHLGLIPMLSNLFRQHISGELPVQLELVCSAILALRFLGVGSVEESHSSKAEIVWALNGRDLKEPTLDFWKKFSTMKLPKRFDLILKNEIVQQMAHGALFRIVPENGPPVILDAQFSRLGDGTAAETLPITRALDALSERIIANNRPAIIAGIDESDGARDQLKGFMGLFCRPENRLKEVEILNGSGEIITSFSQIPKKRRNFIIGIDATSRLFDVATSALKWGSFSPLYVQRLDQVYRFAEIESAVLADRMGLNYELAKMIVLSQDHENAPKIILLTNMKGLPGKAVAEQFLNRWPISDRSMPKIGFFDINEVNNTLDSFTIESVLASFDLLKYIILKYLTQVHFRDIENISDITTLDRILYTVNGKILKKEDHLKACINSYQPEQLNELLKSASISLTRLHIADQNKRNIVILAGK